ncbi:hypothetical protein [Bacteroides xylanisolvens]|uniref:hypothetical protein n=1 Tax=Bacteroides xylanisolvens TaxID=371601 RepID=UPI0035690BCB
MNTAMYHCFHTWAVSHPTGVHSTVPSQSAPHQYDFSCAGPIRYMQPCVTLKTECTFDAKRQYSLCTTVSIKSCLMASIRLRIIATERCRIHT